MVSLINILTSPVMQISENNIFTYFSNISRFQYILKKKVFFYFRINQYLIRLFGKVESSKVDIQDRYLYFLYNHL
jgi:hypothetical protein